MDREMLLNIEIQKQNLKALPERFKAQKKVVSPVTQQMIDDYKQQFRDSYKRTDDKGSSKFYKFLIPEAEPTLEIIDKDELLKSGILKQEFTVDVIKKKLIDLNLADESTRNISIDDIKDQINYLAFTEYPDQEQGLRDQYRIIEESKIKINELTAKRNIKTQYDDEYFNLDKKIKNNEKRIKLANETIPTIIINLRNITTQINQLTRIIEENDENKLFNEKVLYTIEQNNKKKLADYAKTIQIMNNGEISLEQQQGESEQDYLKRLADVALIEEDPTRAFLYNTNQFKKNLKTLIKSEWKIENLIKTFSNDDQFLLNKTFAGFKKHFNNLYGPGNKDLDVEEYVNIIRDYIDSEATSLVKKAGTKREKEEEKGEPAEEPRLLKRYVKSLYDDDDDSKSDGNEPIDQGYLPGDEAPAPTPAPPVDASSVIYADVIPPKEYKYLEISKSDDVLRFENKFNSRSIFFKLGPKPPGPNTNEIIQYVIADNVEDVEDVKVITNGTLETGSKFPGSFNGILKDVDKLNLWSEDITLLKDRIKEISKIANLRPSAFIIFFKSFTSGSGLTGKALQDLKKPEKTRSKSSKVLKPTGKALQGLKKPEKPKKQLVVQKGASIKEVPYRCEFGKSVILLNKLYYNNILSVKDSKGINIQGIPNSKVDDKFVNIIMKICNNEDINNKDVLELTDKDAILFSVLMNKSGLKKKYNIDNTKSIKALKDRLALVEGQMLAGNTNDEIKTELYDIVFKLAQLGATSLSVARKYFKDTEKLMF